MLLGEPSRTDVGPAIGRKRRSAMKQTNSCRRQVIVEDGVAKIEHCVCGMIHVSVGPITVRLDPNTFEAVSTSFATAMEKLKPRPAKSRPPLPS
jgi:hypothetical protein